MKKTIGLIFLVLVLAIGGIVFYMYNAKENEKAEVQDLYASISVETSSEGSYDYHNGVTDVMYTTSMASALKNYYGYINLDDASIKTGVCNNYPNQKNGAGLIGTYYCGDSESDFTKETSTKVILSKDLKESVESIFGDSSYTATSFEENMYATSKYIYDETTSTYVLVSLQGGGTGPRTKYSFVSYTKTDDSIVIIEKASDYDETTSAYVDNGTEYEITFKSDDNSDYIFYSIEKVK